MVEPTEDVLRLLERLEETVTPPLSSLAVHDARRQIEALLTTDIDSPPLEAVSDVQIDTGTGQIPLRLYYPELADCLPVLLYFHGGGWISGSISSHDDLCRELAVTVPCGVVSVGYHLAPEHPFPVGLQDAFAATRWVSRHAEALGFDPDRIAIGGDSAGGNIAIGTALLAADRGGPEFVHQAVAYPPMKNTFDTPSYSEVGDRFLLTKDSMQAYWNYYLDSPINGGNHYASPLRARSLADLPPATILTAELDPLRSEGDTYARRLQRLGVPTRKKHFDGVIHAFLSFSELAARSEGIDVLAQELAQAFA